jgi:RNA methyltransferase, TrmH family
MLSKNKIKLIQSLSDKKSRQAENLFVLEGTKIVKELLQSSIEPVEIYATQDWVNESDKNILSFSGKIEVVSEDEIKKISFQKTPQEVIALAHLPKRDFNAENLKNKLSLILDTIQDPGNLGTIIRIADWFGIEDIICSPETADAFNPKVVQSTMGAILRVKIHYLNLNEVLDNFKRLKIPVYGTVLDGENIYKAELSKNGAIIMGNESNGVNTQLMPFINKKLLIPNFPEGIRNSESLNVGIATAITCAEFRRRISL